LFSKFVRICGAVRSNLFVDRSSLKHYIQRELQFNTSFEVSIRVRCFIVRADEAYRDRVNPVAVKMSNTGSSDVSRCRNGLITTFCVPMPGSGRTSAGGLRFDRDNYGPGLVAGAMSGSVVRG